jgi:hypothetical protein
MDRGKKNRKNIRKQVVRNAATLAQTIRRRILLTGGSGLLSTRGPVGRFAGRAETAVGAGAGAPAPSEAGVLFSFSADLSWLT